MKKLLADYQRHDNLPVIQVLIFIRESLAKYYQKVKGKKYDLVEILDLELDLRERCPLCGGKDCAGFIGYYTRVVIDEHGTYFKEFPIARYVCKGKGERSWSGHKTFSLLPYRKAHQPTKRKPKGRCGLAVWWSDWLSPAAM